jgi:hypothetical protein
MQALIKAPDCFASVMTLLDPHELQNMRSASKAIYKGITKKVMLQCIKSTIDRFAGLHAMPDGAVRFYSPFGKSTFVICKFNDGYQLKQEGFNVHNYDLTSFKKITLDALLHDSGWRMLCLETNVHRVSETSTLSFELNIKDKKPQIAFKIFCFEPPNDPLAGRHERFEKKITYFHDFDFYRRRLNEERPTLLQQLFEAKDKISALESEKTALQTRLANAEAQDRRREEKVTLK